MVKEEEKEKEEKEKEEEGVEEEDDDDDYDDGYLSHHVPIINYSIDSTFIFGRMDLWHNRDLWRPVCNTWRRSLICRRGHVCFDHTYVFQRKIKGVNKLRL